jgi:adenylate kinase family enzyme
MIIELALEPEEITKRLTLRCQTSERPDDREEIVKKRLTNYIDHTSPMFDYYRQFGKVRTVNANQDSQVIYNQLKTILTPQTTFLIGPKASGKTTLGKQIAERTNMVFMNFNDFVKKNHLKGKDDETVVLALIKSLSYQIEPRLLIEGFPQNEF